MILIIAKQPGCPACTAAEKELRAFQYPGVEIKRYNVLASTPEVLEGQKVTATPTYFLVDGSRVIGRQTGGLTAAQLRTWIARRVAVWSTRPGSMFSVGRR